MDAPLRRLSSLILDEGWKNSSRSLIGASGKISYIDRMNYPVPGWSQSERDILAALLYGTYGISATTGASATFGGTQALKIEDNAGAHDKQKFLTLRRLWNERFWRRVDGEADANPSTEVALHFTLQDDDKSYIEDRLKAWDIAYTFPERKKEDPKTLRISGAENIDKLTNRLPRLQLHVPKRIPVSSAPKLTSPEPVG